MERLSRARQTGCRVPALGAAANKNKGNYHRLGQAARSVSYCLKAGYVPWADRDVQPTRLDFPRDYSNGRHSHCLWPPQE
ncbi:MAG: hypothetical protein KAV82_07700 [Phycisphaerae bacterium]|nr:hypothetical protein [Phycisphaerae bacterium]